MADIGRLLSGLTKGSSEGIRAYHASPHDFTRFDLGKIGTGEGAQTYGHGLYFAENPAVSGRGGEYWNSFLRQFEGPERSAAEYLMSTKFDREAALKAIQTDIDRLHENPAWRDVAKEGESHLREQMKLIESGKPVGPRTYEVNIKARPEQFLDWDKPLSQQPQIRDILGGTEQLYHAERMGLKDPTGEQLIRKVAGDAPATSAELKEAGIPGIRYLDQGSRAPAQLDARIEVLRKDLASGLGDHRPMLNRLESLLNDRARYSDPTSNYVVFDPRRIDILRKYGLAGMAPVAGAGAAALMPGQAEASTLPIKQQLPELPNQSMGPALAALSAGDVENQAAADAMRVPGPPAPPPLPQRPPLPPSQFAPMPASPAMPPEWLTRELAPHLTNPATYQTRLPPTIATNAAGKTYPPEMTHPWQGAAADLTNIASMLVGPW